MDVKNDAVLEFNLNLIKSYLISASLDEYSQTTPNPTKK